MFKFIKDAFVFRKNDLVPALVVAAVLPWTLFFMGLNIWRGNPIDIAASWSSMLTCGAFIATFWTLILFLVQLPFCGRKLFGLVNIFVFAMGLFAWIEGNLFNWKFGVMDGRQIDLSRYQVHIWGEILFFAAVFAVMIYYRKNIAKRLVPIALIVILMQPLGTVMSTLSQKSRTSTPSASASDQANSPAPSTIRYNYDDSTFFPLSDKKNVLIFVLDTFHSDLARMLFHDDPTLKETFRDFTFFDKCYSVPGSTFMNVPAILTGQYNEHAGPGGPGGPGAPPPGGPGKPGKRGPGIPPRPPFWAFLGHLFGGGPGGPGGPPPGGFPPGGAMPPNGPAQAKAPGQPGEMGGDLASGPGGSDYQGFQYKAFESDLALFKTLSGQGYNCQALSFAPQLIQWNPKYFCNMKAKPTDTFTGRLEAESDAVRRASQAVFFRAIPTFMKKAYFLPEAICVGLPMNLVVPMQPEMMFSSSFDQGIYHKIATAPEGKQESSCLRFCHMMGAHTPFSRALPRSSEVDRASGPPFGNGNETATSETAIAKDVLAMMKECLEYLKKTGQYDSTLIIIMGDHGCMESVLDVCESYSWSHVNQRKSVFNSPMLLVKKPDAKQDTMKWSDVPVHTYDIPQTVFTELGIHVRDDQFSILAMPEAVKEKRLKETQADYATELASFEKAIPTATFKMGSSAADTSAQDETPPAGGYYVHDFGNDVTTLTLYGNIDRERLPKTGELFLKSDSTKDRSEFSFTPECYRTKIWRFLARIDFKTIPDGSYTLGIRLGDRQFKYSVPLVIHNGKPVLR